MKAHAPHEAAPRRPPRPDRAAQHHERAADRAASRALSSADGFAHRAPIAAAPLAGLGGGTPLPEATRAHFERRLGADLSAVRVHTDANAGRAARAEGAAAFAFGTDLVFASGRYAPDTSAGKRLLAHELAHVVQQSGGAPALGLGAAPFGVQRSVETLGGSWDIDSYSLTYSRRGAHRGCEVNRLRFQPNEQVNASRIGLVQAVVSRESGAVTAINPTVDTRSIPAGEADEGLHIDRLAERRNPVYGMDDPTSADPTLGDSTAASNGEWGFRFRPLPLLVPSLELQNDATLYDRPALPGHGANSSQVFETTALAVDGEQAGTFYGSVRWGWTSDAANVPSLVPLGVVSTGVPTASFRVASGLWNANPTSTGADTLDLPIAAGTSGGRLPRDMTTSEIMARLEQIRAERAQAVVGNVLAAIGHGSERTTETLDFEAAALRRELFQRMGDFPAPNLPPGTAYA
jgi:hypothetical protein